MTQEAFSARFKRLGRIGTGAARQALRGREEVEVDAWVREEIAAALDAEGRPPIPRRGGAIGNGNRGDEQRHE